MELQTLRADLAGVRRSFPPPPFKDESRLPFGNSSQKGEVHIGFMHADRVYMSPCSRCTFGMAASLSLLRGRSL